MNYNPFVTGNAVRNPAYFVGRIRESNDILAKVQTHNSVSVVGERRIGKQYRVPLRLHSQSLFQKHILNFQIPSVWIWDIGKRERQPSQFERKGIDVCSMQATAQIRPA